MIIDSHCHLDYEPMFSNLDDIIKRAKDSDVKFMLTISVADKKFDVILNITKKFKNVYGTYGIHPHEAKNHKEITKDIILKKINMSKKRNIGVSLSKTKYVAFLDSDCYPTKNWIYNAIKILKKNKNIGLITGPDFPFSNQTGFQKTIGIAHKSFILSGSKIFRKS